MNSKPRKKYDQDFKRNAVLLCSEPGKSVTQVAENLGINKDLLYCWRREYHRANGQYVFPGPGKGLMIHSDRGVHYASSDFKKILVKQGFIQSMSREGNCWDTVAESFFHTLKTQLIYHVHFSNFGEAEKNLFKYIEVYYNQRRKHSTNGWKTPAFCEQEWCQFKKVA